MEIELPDEISREYIKALASVMEPTDVYLLQDDILGMKRDGLRDRIKNQVDDVEDIYDQMSSLQYYQGEIEISPHLRAVFRTLTTSAQDEVFSFAKDNSNGSADVYQRLQSKRKLAYGALKINTSSLVGVPVTQSYLDLKLSGVDVDEKLKAIAEEAFGKLELFPEMLINKVTEAFSIWEGEVYDRIDSIDSYDELAKNSTGTPSSELSAH
jgi:hypothetical protein